MRFEIARVRAMYAEAEPGIAMLASESRFTVRLALGLYRRILERIEANDYDVFTQRAYVPFRTKLLMAHNLARFSHGDLLQNRGTSSTTT